MKKKSSGSTLPGKSFFQKRRLIIVSAIMVFLLLVIFLSPVVLTSILRGKIEEYAEKHSIQITLGDIRLKKWKQLFIKDCRILSPDSRDTVFYLNTFVADIGYFRKSKLSLHPVNIGIDSLFVNVQISQKKSESQQQKKESMPEKIDRYLTLFTDLFPEAFDVRVMDIRFPEDTLPCHYRLDSFQTKGERLSGTLHMQEGNHRSLWHITGTIDTEKQDFSGRLVLDGQEVTLPEIYLFRKLTRLGISFRELAFTLRLFQKESDDTHFSFGGEIKESFFFHPDMSEEAILIDSASFGLNALLSSHKITIDSSSSLVVNGFSFHPYFSYEKQKDKHIILKIDERDFEATDFFKSLPPGLFQMISKIKASGKMSFYLLFDCDYANVENLKFDFGLSSESLVLSGRSRELLKRYNRDFKLAILDQDVVEIRELDVSKANPDFVAFDHIPFYLRDAILASEDPSFFKHDGFIKNSIRDAMAVNIQRGRYSRGGSTITMQFVKNIFLNKKKVASRKFEEMILVWLIEREALIPKERMFEIYVNIIEWAPCVYGLTEASRFYFDKSPDLLSFGECVYLATLIRAPKQYAKTLSKDGEVTNSRRSEMHFIAKRMMERNMVTEQQYDTFNSYVRVAIDEEKIEKTICPCEEKREEYAKKKKSKL